MTAAHDLDALLALEAKCLPHTSIIRYEHGGGRVFCKKPRALGEGVELIADFYREPERECWIAARNALRPLCEELRSLRAELEQVAFQRNRAAVKLSAALGHPALELGNGYMDEALMLYAAKWIAARARTEGGA